MKIPGTVWAWGLNDHGQLDNENEDNSLEPLVINRLSKVSAVAAGNYFSMALIEDGTLWAWGDNTYGQLGIGTSGGFSNTPMRVQNLTNKIVRAISCGFRHSLAILSDGTLLTWGDNTYGQLGLGSSGSTPVTTPTQVTALNNITAIAAGGYHSIAHLANGTLWAWGLNGSGQLGLGHNNSPVTTPAQINLGNVSAIAAGGYHSLALLSDRTVWSWGANYSGQLGTGSLISSNKPVEVEQLSYASSISCGLDHSLAIVSTSLWTWGRNDYGQLGLSSISAAESIPQQVALSNVADAAGGLWHSLALLSDGTIKAWGDNTYGELGNGLKTSSSTPVSVITLKNISTITQTYGWHNLAVTNGPARGIEWLS